MVSSAWTPSRVWATPCISRHHLLHRHAESPKVHTKDADCSIPGMCHESLLSEGACLPKAIASFFRSAPILAEHLGLRQDPSRYSGFNAASPNFLRAFAMRHPSKSSLSKFALGTSPCLNAEVLSTCKCRDLYASCSTVPRNIWQHSSSQLAGTPAASTKKGAKFGSSKLLHSVPGCTTSNPDQVWRQKWVRNAHKGLRMSDSMAESVGQRR